MTLAATALNRPRSGRGRVLAQFGHHLVYEPAPGLALPCGVWSSPVDGAQQQATERTDLPVQRDQLGEHGLGRTVNQPLLDKGIHGDLVIAHVRPGLEDPEASELGVDL